jgi:hypothetical protein
MLGIARLVEQNPEVLREHWQDRAFALDLDSNGYISERDAHRVRNADPEIVIFFEEFRSLRAGLFGKPKQVGTYEFAEWVRFRAEASWVRAQARAA